MINFRDYLGPEKLREDAYHEAGHVVMNWLVGNGTDLAYIDMEPSGGASAEVIFTQDSACTALIANYYQFKLGRHKAVQAVMINLAGPGVVKRGQVQYY